jgi:hypothetical protein
MASLKKTSTPELFVKLHMETFSKGETNDCSVKAVAIACGVTYDVAHAALKSFGRKDRSGCHDGVIRMAIVSLGFKVVKWGVVDRHQMIESYPGVHKNLTSITTHHPRRFAKAWAKQAHKNLLFVTDAHILAVSGGNVIDWSINKSYRVQQVWEIVKA